MTSVGSLKLVHVWSNISQSMQSKHPCKQAILFSVQSFTVFTARCTRWMTGLYTGARSTLLRSADPRGGNARDVDAPGTVPKHKSIVWLKRVGQVTYWWYVFKVVFRERWLKSPSMNFGASVDIESSLWMLSVLCSIALEALAHGWMYTSVKKPQKQQQQQQQKAGGIPWEGRTGGVRLTAAQCQPCKMLLQQRPCCTTFCWRH